MAWTFRSVTQAFLHHLIIGQSECYLPTANLNTITDILPRKKQLGRRHFAGEDFPWKGLSAMTPTGGLQRQRVRPPWSISTPRGLPRWLRSLVDQNIG